jgi:cob(I)alamin adenosyltransferase
MKNRLTKIYTKSGDAGLTGLGDGKRVSKNHPRVWTYGTLDELNSQMGLVVLYAEKSFPELVPTLRKLQNTLFDLGGELCIPGYACINAQDTLDLEALCDQYNHDLPPLKDFILPGGSELSAHVHIARGICRRAERHLVHLMEIETEEKNLNPHALTYLNPLSDWLFILARYVLCQKNIPEIIWQKRQ